MRLAQHWVNRTFRDLTHTQRGSCCILSVLWVHAIISTPARFLARRMVHFGAGMGWGSARALCPDH